jgi:hypothetical protein
MSAIPNWKHERAVLARRTRDFGPGSPQAVKARRDFEVARLAEHVQRVVDAAPPLTAEQHQRLASLLAPFVGAA